MVVYLSIYATYMFPVHYSIPTCFSFLVDLKEKDQIKKFRSDRTTRFMLVTYRTCLWACYDICCIIGISWIKFKINTGIPLLK